MPWLVLIADAEKVAGKQFLPGSEERLTRLLPVPRGKLDFSDQHAGTGRLFGRGHTVFPLGQKAPVRTGAPQRHFQQFLGVLSGAGVRPVVAQHPVGCDAVVDVMRPFLAALDFPAAQAGNVKQRPHQHVKGKILTGEKAAFMAFLVVNAAAGLHAASAQAAFAAQVA